MENDKSLLELKEEIKKHGYDTMEDKIVRGIQIIDSSKHESWVKDVIMDTRGCFYGSITESALEVLEAIYEGKTKEEIDSIIKNQPAIITKGIKDIVNKYKESIKALSLSEIAKLHKQKNSK